MKMIFRNKHNGRFLTHIEVLPNYVRMYHEASDRVFWYKKATLHEHLQVVHHDVRVGDVLRDTRDGSLLEVLRVSTDGVMLRSGKTQRGVLLTGLVNYARVGRNYKLKRPGVVAKEITRTEHPYAKYDERKVREHIDNARAQAAAMIQAGDDAKRFGIGVLLVYPDGSMKAIDPRSVILK